MFSTILLSSDDGVAIIKLNEEKSLNALSYLMLKELKAALDLIGKDESLKVTILWGGESVFGAGANLKESFKNQQ